MRRKVITCLIVGVLVLRVLTANVDTPDHVQTEKTIHDENMPRSKSFTSMETGDAEFLALLEKAEARRAATEAKTAGQQADAEVKIGIHAEDVITVYQPGHLTASLGVFSGPSGREKWYNLDMSNVVYYMRQMGYDDRNYPYWVRDDGVKMLGDYVMIAANVDVRPKGTVLETSLGRALVCDACVEAINEPTLIDIAVTW